MSVEDLFSGVIRQLWAVTLPEDSAQVKAAINERTALTDKVLLIEAAASRLAKAFHAITTREMDVSAIDAAWPIETIIKAILGERKDMLTLAAEADDLEAGNELAAAWVGLCSAIKVFQPSLIVDR